MKYFIGIGTLMILYTVNQAVAETAIRSELLPLVDQNPILVAQEIEEKSNNPEEQIDSYLNYLLTIPFDQRQYLFPALFDIPNMPKKIRTHPEIAIWEGKMPINIDPEKQEFAKRYLKDLNPVLYLYLAPRGLPEGGDVAGPKGSSISRNHGLVVSPKVDAYPTVRETLKQPENLRNNPHLALLTKEDIKKIEKGLSILENYLQEKIKDKPNTFEKYKLLTLYYIDADKERINPFQTHIERLDLLKRLKPLEDKIKEVGFTSAQDFAVKADTLAKAYRAAKMTYLNATQARRYRNINPRNRTEKNLWMVSKMYEAYPSDVRLVRENLEDVRQIFIQSGFQSVLNAETFDEFKK